MTGPNSWEVDSYREGKWKVSVRRNLENDRIDEGDSPRLPFQSKEDSNSERDTH